MVTVQEPAPVQSFDQLERNQPAAAAGVNDTLVGESNCALHALVHEMPAGLLVTVPLPLTATCSVWWMTGGGVQPLVHHGAASWFCSSSSAQSVPSGPDVLPKASASRPE